MKKFKKFLSVFVLLALMLIPLTSCEAETQVEESDTEVIPEEEVTYVISVAGLEEYSLVRSEDASEDLVSAVSELYRNLREISTKIVLKDDYYREDLPEYTMGDYEIIIGNTNRPESAEFIDELRTQDYGYVMRGKKIIIAGSTDEYTEKAVRQFLRTVVRGDFTDDIFYSPDDDFIELGTYPLDSLTVENGDTQIPIRYFSIVYPENGNSAEHLCAEILSSNIAEVTGYTLEIISDTEEKREHEILIGNTNRGDSVELSENEYCIDISGDTIHLYGNDSTALLNAVHKFDEGIRPLTKNIVLAEDSMHRYNFENSTLTAMSFNVLCNIKETERIERVMQMIKNYLPDTIGVQEATRQWILLLNKEFGDFYGCVGEGRDGDTNGEYTAIYYNKSVFDLVDSGTKWLSETPDVVSKFEESSLHRTFTYALLERRTDGRKIMVVNTHLEHTNSISRDLQSAVLAEFLREYAADYPVILTGDFNTESDTTAYANVIDGGVTNARDVADTVSESATFTDFGSANATIDFVFVTKDTIKVNDFKVCTEKINGNFPSDHHPVLIEYIPIG